MDAQSLYESMMKRRSVRAFSHQEIPEPLIDQLLSVANQAPSGGNIQPLSIIVVRSMDGRKRLSELVGGQPWVRNAPLSMVFCLDFYRVKKWAEMSQTDFVGNKALNHFLIAYADLMVAAQNVVILAQGLGLGSVYVGSIQNEIDAARQYFRIPAYVLPMMVLSLGYPKSVPKRVPKLNREAITHWEKYREPKDDEIRRAFDDKYGPVDDNIEKYLDKVFVEVLEADKQDAPQWLERVKQEMKRLDIQSTAAFLFRVRYPGEVMVKMNERLARSFRNAGFEVV
ncbi:MAG: nitroreductase family protein [Thermodesulfobacteriota bacterium]